MRHHAAQLFYTPLGRRLLALFVLCTVLPATLLAALTLRGVSDHLAAATSFYLRQEAKSLAMSLLERLDLLQRELGALALGGGDTGGAPAASFVAAGRVTVEGVPLPLIADRPPPALGAAALTRLRGGRPVLLVEPGSVPPMATLLVPLQGGGYAWGLVRPEELWKRGSTIPPRVELSVLTVGGARLIASGGVPAAVEGELLARAGTESSGEVDWADSRGRYVGAFWTLPMAGNFGAGDWVISLHLPAHAAAAPVLAFRDLFLAVVVLAVLASVLAASASIRRALAPLDHLVAATRRVGEQDFAVSLPASVTADLRELSAAFTTMAERLRQQFAALEAERARLSGLVEHAPYGVLLLDGDGHVGLANELARGYLQGLVGDHGGPLYTLAGWSLDELVAHGGWRQVSVPAMGSSPREFVLAARELAAGGRGASRLVVLRDVTEESRLQRRLEQGDRLAAVGRLAAGMAHDLNNILQGITMCSELLRPALAHSPAALDDLTAMQRLEDRAAALIRQVLDFTRQSPVAFANEVALVPVVEEAVHLLRRTLPPAVRVELVVAPTVRASRVCIDPGRLHQVLTNLAVNSRDAMPDGGLLTLTIEPAGDAVLGEQVLLSVRDTGSGIPRELQGKVFDPFFTTKPLGQGTGLGLAQVYGIVTQHEGSVELFSTPGKGTEVRILLPLVGAGRATATAGPSPA